MSAGAVCSITFFSDNQDTRKATALPLAAYESEKGKHNKPLPLVDKPHV